VSLDSYAEKIKIVDSWDFRDIPHSETRDFLSMVFAAVRGLKSGYVLIKMISMAKDLLYMLCACSWTVLALCVQNE